MPPGHRDVCRKPGRRPGLEVPPHCHGHLLPQPARSPPLLPESATRDANGYRHHRSASLVRTLNAQQERTDSYFPGYPTRTTR